MGAEICSHTAVCILASNQTLTDLTVAVMATRAASPDRRRTKIGTIGKIDVD
jgi:hypothetical protein